MAVRYNQRWEEIEKSGTPLERLFESYALFNRSEGKASASAAGGGLQESFTENMLLPLRARLRYQNLQRIMTPGIRSRE